LKGRRNSSQTDSGGEGLVPKLDATECELGLRPLRPARGHSLSCSGSESCKRIGRLGRPLLHKPSQKPLWNGAAWLFHRRGKDETSISQLENRASRACSSIITSPTGLIRGGTRQDQNRRRVATAKNDLGRLARVIAGAFNLTLDDSCKQLP
jgi:hypothetical protein